MSGVNRNIKAELVSDGRVSLSEVQSKFSPEAIRSEKGIAAGRKGADKGEYRGKNAMDAKKK